MAGSTRPATTPTTRPRIHDRPPSRRKPSAAPTITARMRRTNHSPARHGRSARSSEPHRLRRRLPPLHDPVAHLDQLLAERARRGLLARRRPQAAQPVLVDRGDPLLALGPEDRGEDRRHEEEDPEEEGEDGEREHDLAGEHPARLLLAARAGHRGHDGRRGCGVGGRRGCTRAEVDVRAGGEGLPLAVPVTTSSCTPVSPAGRAIDRATCDSRARAAASNAWATAARSSAGTTLIHHRPPRSSRARALFGVRALERHDLGAHLGLGHGGQGRGPGLSLGGRTARDPSRWCHHRR